jgi:hypothetical protein
MGMPALSIPDKADFSGIYDRTLEPWNLFIAHIAHQPSLPWMKRHRGRGGVRGHRRR